MSIIYECDIPLCTYKSKTEPLLTIDFAIDEDAPMGMGDYRHVTRLRLNHVCVTCYTQIYEYVQKFRTQKPDDIELDRTGECEAHGLQTVPYSPYQSALCPECGKRLKVPKRAQS